MAYHTSFYRHAASFQAAAVRHGFECHVSVPDCAMHLRDSHGTHVWRPTFISVMDKRLCYTGEALPSTIGFGGWTPYPAQSWPVGSDKLHFKEYAFQTGLPTPAATQDSTRITGPFIIKGRKSSFGLGFRGPFLSFDATDPKQQLAEGEFYENFIVGLIAKAWYCGSEVAAIHAYPPTVVTGDGELTLRQLVGRLPNNRGTDHDWEVILNLAHYCGISSLDDRPLHGKDVVVEYRYGSRYRRETLVNENLAHTLKNTSVDAAFRSAGELLVESIHDPQMPRDRVYTADALVTVDNEVLFLEVNCCPTIHPDAYELLLGSSGRRCRGYRASS